MTDDQLLERLAAALAPVGSPSEPPPASLQNLHRAIDGARVRGVTVMRPRRGSRALTIAVTAGVASVVLIAFVVASTSLRRIDGEVAVEVTTTVPSSELLEARARADALEDALEEGDVAAVTAEVAKLGLPLSGSAPATGSSSESMSPRCSNAPMRSSKSMLSPKLPRPRWPPRSRRSGRRCPRPPPSRRSHRLSPIRRRQVLHRAARIRPRPAPRQP